MPTESELRTQLVSLGGVLATRARTERLLDRYFEGDCPLPEAIVRAKVTKAYRMLMGMSEAPWGSLVVNSVQNRLEVTGINSGDKDVDSQLWGVWQDNGMDAESKLAHNAALVSGRAFALVWPDDDTQQPEITLDNSSQMVIRYREGSRRRREAAMRFWTDEDDKRPYANLYRPDGIYKFIGPKNSTGIDGVQWQMREVLDEDWPVENPFGVVTAVELPVNRRLKPGAYGYARGEYAHCTSLIDRINLLTFLGLIVAFWQGFPVRGLIGDKIIRDDEGKPIPPFELAADQIVQLENPDAKFADFTAAERSNLSVYAELDQLATITGTPRHYFPLQQGMSNLSADAIRASEGSLVAKIPDHKASLGEGWEEVLRLSGVMLDTPVELSQRAELQWSDHETRSLAERADAAVKLKDIIPQSAIIEYVLNATAEQMARWRSERAGDVMSTLLAAATTPTPQPVISPVPVNGVGAAA
jgi:Phage portal protein, SPP1 Gp6-like